MLDEAHNICPAEPAGPLQAALVDRLVQIAAEGRKYGLWLLLSTQRPSKIHPQVLSQCDNLVLMRMNSRADSPSSPRCSGSRRPRCCAPRGYFVQGEALLAGGLVPVPSLIRMGARLTVEGGSDIGVPGQLSAEGYVAATWSFAATWSVGGRATSSSSSRIATVMPRTFKVQPPVGCAACT